MVVEWIMTALAAVMVVFVGLFYFRTRKNDSPTEAKDTVKQQEDEIRRLREEQEAFKRQMSYSVEDAYGLNEKETR